MNFISNLFKKKTLDDIRITPSDIPAMAKIKNEDVEAWKAQFLAGVYSTLKRNARTLQKGGDVMIAVTAENGYIKDGNKFYIFIWESNKNAIIDELKSDGWIIQTSQEMRVRYHDDVLDYFHVSKP